MVDHPGSNAKSLARTSGMPLDPLLVEAFDEVAARPDAVDLDDLVETNPAVWCAVEELDNDVVAIVTSVPRGVRHEVGHSGAHAVWVLVLVAVGHPDRVRERGRQMGSHLKQALSADPLGDDCGVGRLRVGHAIGIAQRLARHAG